MVIALPGTPQLGDVLLGAQQGHHFLANLGAGSLRNKGLFGEEDIGPSTVLVPCAMEFLAAHVLEVTQAELRDLVQTSPMFLPLVFAIDGTPAVILC